jgi:hypothetical protein
MIVRGLAPSGDVLTVPSGNVQVGGATQGVTLTNGGLIQGNALNLINPGTRTISCGAITATAITSPGANSIGGVTIGTPSGQVTATNVSATSLVASTGSIGGVTIGTPSGKVTATSALIGGITMGAISGTISGINTIMTGTVAALALSTIQSINGGQVSAAPGFAPQFNSSAAPQLFAPFAPGGTSYFVNISINTACSVRVFATATRTNTQVIAPPVGGAWNVTILYYNSGVGVGYQAITTPIYTNGVVLTGGNFFALGSPILLNISNTSGVTLDQLDVSYHCAPFVN